MKHLRNLGDLLDRENDLSKPALIDLSVKEKVRQFSHKDIDEAAKAMARGLLKRGFKRGDHIAILAANSAEFLIAYLGTMRAGMISIPINHKFPGETIEFILSDAACKLVLTDRDRLSQVPTGYPVVVFSGTDENNFDDWLDWGDFETIIPEKNEVAMFLYTSGSTGRPKGVPLTHEGHLWVIEMRLKQKPEPFHKC